MNVVSIRAIQSAFRHRGVATQSGALALPKADAAVETWVGWLGCVTGIGGAGLLASHAPCAGWGFVCFLVSNVALLICLLRMPEAYEHAKKDVEKSRRAGTVDADDRIGKHIPLQDEAPLARQLVASLLFYPSNDGYQGT